MGVGDGWDLPPGTEPWSDFHWFQASTKGMLELVILSDKPGWYTGHFVGGRMVPCAGSGCELCSTGIGGQVRFVFAVADTSTKRVGLIEFGRSNGAMIRDWSDRFGGLRGLRIEVSKHSRNVQSRTEVTYIEAPCEPWFLGLHTPDVQLALYLTWHKAGMIMPESFSARMADVLQRGRSDVMLMSQKEMFAEKAKIIGKGRSRG